LKKLVQRLLFGIGILSLGITFTGCHASHSQTDSQKTISRQTEPQAGPTETETSSTLSLIDASGMTLESRIHTSDGYTRTKEADGSLAEFLRNYAMEPDQSPVLLYDGSKKRNQKAHVAVFDLPLEHEDLQQCADSVIRVYAEYFWSTKQYDRIAFHFTNGFDAQTGIRKNDTQIVFQTVVGSVRLCTFDPAYIISVYTDTVTVCPLRILGVKSIRKMKSNAIVLLCTYQKYSAYTRMTDPRIAGDPQCYKVGDQIRQHGVPFVVSSFFVYVRTGTN